MSHYTNMYRGLLRLPDMQTKQVELRSRQRILVARRLARPVTNRTTDGIEINVNHSRGHGYSEMRRVHVGSQS